MKVFATVAAAVCLLSSMPAYSGVSYPAEAFQKTPQIGQGFSSGLVRLKENCLSGPPRYIKQNIAEVDFDYHRSHSEETRRLVMESAHGANLVFAKGKQSIKISELHQNNKFQTTLVYRAYYLTKISGEGDQLVPSPLGERLLVSGDWAMIAQNCGEHYVSKITYGGQLHLVVNFRFRNLKAKREVEQKIEASFLGIRKVAVKKHYSEQTAKDANVSITAIQHGGNPQLLEQLLGNVRSLDCSLAKPELCNKSIETLLIYATDVKHGFPSQIADSPIRVSISSYYDSAHGEFAKEPPALWDHANKEALYELASILSKSLSLQTSAQKAWQSGKISKELELDWKFNMSLIDQNVLSIRSAISSCNQRPEECISILEAARNGLADINKTILIAELKFRTKQEERQQ